MTAQFLVFRLADKRLGLSLQSIQRIIGAVEVMPLPEAQRGILGMINVHGRGVTLLDLRPDVGQESEEIKLDDVIILCTDKDEMVGILADTIIQVKTVEDENLLSRTDESVFPQAVTDDDGVILICDAYGLARRSALAMQR
jgi:chemotaxis signal transduction protein